MAPAKKTRTKAPGKPKQPAASKRTADRPPRVPIARVRQLAAALEHADVSHQVAGLHAVLGELAADAASTAAAAALAHTKRGHAVARAYLTVLASGPNGDGSAANAADTIVRHCATMEWGRKAMKGAFVATWKRAHDLTAVEAAIKNFSRGLIDDPDLLEVAVEAAQIVGDHLGSAEHRSRLERARRLQPLIRELAGAAPARARAAKQLAALSADDRWHVHARVLDQPRSFDEAIAAAAVVELANDLRVPDMCLSAAIAEMQHHGNEALIAAWKPRVAAGDAALISRILGLFEWTALWATDGDQLEIYVHALYPAGGRPEVFAQVEHALGSEREVVREAVCEAWLGEAEGLKAFDDRQVDRLMRMVVAIAEAGADTADRDAAGRVLADVAHPGARQALIDAIKHARVGHDAELRGKLYQGLSHLKHPDVVAFLAERLFVEREAYLGLERALDRLMDAAVHRRVMTTLTTRAGEPHAIHAATLYVEVLLDDHGSPRLLVELGRAALAWQAPSNDDQRRLRYLFERAVLAALAIKSPDDARAFLARARELPASPYSDAHAIGRDKKTPSPLADAANKKLVAALEAGALDQELAAARAEADAARAAGTPLEASDARLGALAGCTVSGRFFEERESRVVWFFDEIGTLHVYDGYAIARPPCTVTGTAQHGIPWGGMTAFLEDHTTISERALLLDPKHTIVREVIRLGNRLLVNDGAGTDTWDRIPVTPLGLRFENNADARATFDRLVANPPAGLKRRDSWYVERVGAVEREYYVPLPDGGYNTNGTGRLVVLGNEITGYLDDGCPPIERKAYASSEAAIAALQAWESRVLARGGRPTRIGLDRSATRREDTLLATFLSARARDDAKGAAWHLRALGEMLDAVAAAGLAHLVPDIQVLTGPRATEAQIAAYQAAVPEPLPASLLEVWREVGGADFTCDRVSVKFLSPAEVLANRAALRARLSHWLTTRLAGKKRAALLEDLEGTDVLATLDGEPLILFDTRQHDQDGRCYAAVGSTWSEASLGWQIATAINHELERELMMRLGDAFRLRLGERAGADTRRARMSSGDKVWEAIADGPLLLTRTVTPTRPGKPSIKELGSSEAATKAFEAAVAAARAKGFRPG